MNFQTNWLVGCNFIPSNAINQLEMWQERTFSPFQIDKELSWASDLGFNTIRVFLHDLLWEHDSDGLIKRMDTFLGIASKYKIKVMFVFFDSVWDPFPYAGTQQDPCPGIHNSGWVQSPGLFVLSNTLRCIRLKEYVQGIINHFKDDKRILMWDLFNEPDNINRDSYNDDIFVKNKSELALNLLQGAVQWVREINPSQPITMGIWQGDWNNMTKLDQYMVDNSDVISFHCYGNIHDLENRISILQKYNKPMLCTEYMARTTGSTFENILPILKKYNIGAYNWGFVAGKTQTNCPWNSWKEVKTSSLWFHDIFHGDGTPYDESEVEFIKEIIQESILETISNEIK